MCMEFKESLHNLINSLHQKSNQNPQALILLLIWAQKNKWIDGGNAH